jgi:hypothetical protein
MAEPLWAPAYTELTVSDALAHFDDGPLLPTLRNANMKLALITFALAGATLCSPVFAQTSVLANTNTTASSAAPAPSAPPSSVSQAGQWTPPYGQPTTGLTRAQVYQDLVHSEQDGQLQYLNSTLYSHG